MGNRKAIFLDRDGTINIDPGYLSDPAQVKLFPEASQALARLRAQGFRLIVVSNQSGVGRGYFKMDDLERVHERINELLREKGVEIEHFEVCTEVPGPTNTCRKPRPAMIFEASQRLGIDPQQSFMIGDRKSDLKAGRSAGCRGVILVRTGHGLDESKILSPGEADFIANSLEDSANWILDQEV